MERLREQIENIIQCCIDIATQGDELAIVQELSYVKREILGLLDGYEKHLQKLQDDIIGYLNDYDVVDFAQKNNIKLDSWLKSKLFELIGDIRTEIIMKFSRFEGVELEKKKNE